MKYVRAFIGLLSNVTLFPKKNKTKQSDYEEKKKVSSGRSRTQDLRRVRVTHYPLCHATIAKIVRQINCI